MGETGHGGGRVDKIRLARGGIVMASAHIYEGDLRQALSTLERAEPIARSAADPVLLQEETVAGALRIKTRMLLHHACAAAAQAPALHARLPGAAAFPDRTGRPAPSAGAAAGTAGRPGAPHDAHGAPATRGESPKRRETLRPAPQGSIAPPAELVQKPALRSGILHAGSCPVNFPLTWIDIENRRAL